MLYRIGSHSELFKWTTTEHRTIYPVMPAEMAGIFYAYSLSNRDSSPKPQMAGQRSGSSLEQGNKMQAWNIPVRQDIQTIYTL